MKKIYWRPHGTPLFAIVLVAVFSIGGLIAVEQFQVTERSPYYGAEMQASRLALEAMTAVKEQRLALGNSIDPEVDQAESGLIGTFLSPVTSYPGNLQAKQTSVNPNFAAVVVDLLKQAGVKEGDLVAVSMSGSFPAINLSVLAALKTLKLRPTIISSVASSQWGANDPYFLWIDMEQFLYNRGIFPFRSVAASIGGRYDKGKEMPENGRQAIIHGIERNGLPQITNNTLRENIDQRMGLYLKEGPPKVYINVGGGIASVGAQRRRQRLLKTGLTSPDDGVPEPRNSVVNRFIAEGIPVIHLENIRMMASEYGLPLAPNKVPKPGEGGIYSHKEYNIWLAVGVLSAILLSLYLFSRTDFGFRLVQVSYDRKGAGPPEPMV
jgi:poly-gamma-glutamate system protein